MLAERRIAVLTIAAHAATLLFLLCYFWVLVITAIDSALFYAVFPYRHFVAGALMVLLVLLPGRNWRLKMGLFLIMAVWFSVLPRVSWHEESNFFINAGMIRKGMTVEQARQQMRPFVSAGNADGTELVFQPAPESDDRCVVRVRQGKVREVQLHRGLSNETPKNQEKRTSLLCNPHAGMEGRCPIRVLQRSPERCCG